MKENFAYLCKQIAADNCCLFSEKTIMIKMKPKNITVSLIITTYNRPDALRLSLLSAFAQEVLPDEIIIGDDGSTAETRQLIDSMRLISPVPLIHIWQEDKGFRAAMSRNKCVAAAKGEYIIQVDGDMILHRKFVKDHIQFASRGVFLRGGRTRLGKTLTEELCSKSVLPKIHFWTSGIISKPENLLRIPVIARMLARGYHKKGRTLGCNMSYFKDDFIAVNGYDEFFEGWGSEDSDLARRFTLNGMKRHRLKFVALASHLWHDEKFMYNRELNERYGDRADVEIRCRKGVDRYLPRLNETA